MEMHPNLLKKINEWINELHSGKNTDMARANLLEELKSELQEESEALDRLSKRISTIEEELVERLPIKVGDLVAASIDGEEKIGEITEIHMVALPAEVVIVALSPHFYPEYNVDIDKLRKPSPREIQTFEENREQIEEEIKHKEELDRSK